MGGYVNGPNVQPLYGGQEYAYNNGQPMINQPYEAQINSQPFEGSSKHQPYSQPAYYA